MIKLMADNVDVPSPDHQFWYNLNSGQVEEGMLSPAVERAGPFATRAEAERAPATIRERSARWAAEEAAED